MLRRNEVENDILFVLYSKLKDSLCSVAFFLVLFAHSHDSIFLKASRYLPNYC